MKVKLTKAQEIRLIFLTHFGLFQNGHFSNAAVVLFAKNPARFLPQTRIRVAFLEKGKTADEFVEAFWKRGEAEKSIEFTYF